MLMIPTKTSLHFSELSAFHFFIGSYVLSLWIAFIATLAFESPIVMLERLAFNSQKKSEPVNGTVLNERYNRMNSEPKTTDPQQEV